MYNFNTPKFEKSILKTLLNYAIIPVCIACQPAPPTENFEAATNDSTISRELVEEISPSVENVFTNSVDELRFNTTEMKKKHNLDLYPTLKIVVEGANWIEVAYNQAGFNREDVKIKAVLPSEQIVAKFADFDGFSNVTVDPRSGVAKDENGIEVYDSSNFSTLKDIDELQKDNKNTYSILLQYEVENIDGMTEYQAKLIAKFFINLEVGMVLQITSQPHPTKDNVSVISLFRSNVDPDFILRPGEDGLANLSNSIVYNKLVESDFRKIVQGTNNRIKNVFNLEDPDEVLSDPQENYADKHMEYSEYSAIMESYNAYRKTQNVVYPLADIAVDEDFKDKRKAKKFYEGLVNGWLEIWGLEARVEHLKNIIIEQTTWPAGQSVEIRYNKVEDGINIIIVVSYSDVFNNIVSANSRNEIQALLKIMFIDNNPASYKPEINTFDNTKNTYSFVISNLSGTEEELFLNMIERMTGVNLTKKEEDNFLDYPTMSEAVEKALQTRYLNGIS